jgi:hypothetical protein
MAKFIIDQAPRSIATSSIRALTEVSVAAGNTQIIDGQRSMGKPEWPSIEFWRLLFSTGPIEVERIGTTRDSTTFDVATMTWKDMEDVRKAGLPATAAKVLDERSWGVQTHLRGTAIDTYAPPFLRQTADSTVRPDVFAKQVEWFQLNSLEAYGYLQLSAAISSRIDQALRDPARFEHLFMTNKIAAIMRDNLNILKQYEATALPGWEDFLQRAKRAYDEQEDRSIPFFQRPLPSLLAPAVDWRGEIGSVTAEHAKVLPPSEVQRDSLLWFGSCSGPAFDPFNSRLAPRALIPDAPELFMRSPADLRDAVSPSHKYGFTIPDKPEKLLKALNKASPPADAWKGDYFKGGISARRPKGLLKSDILVILDLAYPVASPVASAVNLDVVDSTTAHPGPNDVPPARLLRLNYENGEQRLLVILKCVPLAALFDDRIKLRITSSDSKSRSAALLNIRFNIASVADNDGPGQLAEIYLRKFFDPLPEWYVRALRTYVLLEGIRMRP